MQLDGFAQLPLFLIGGVVFGLAGTLATSLLAPNRPNPEKLTTYECGEEPIGDARVQFHTHFYLIGLIFLIFDVEVLFLFPWAMVYARPEWIAALPQWGWLALAEMGIFAGILLLGLAYAWIKGDLEWVKPLPQAVGSTSPVPLEAYEAVNARYGGEEGK